MNVSDLAVPSALTSVRAIHQFHPAVSLGDAITGDLLALQEMFRAWGFDSEIFCQFPTSGIQTRPYSGYASKSHPRNILLLHFSIAYSEEVLSLFERLPDQRMLVYHNITPAHYFTGVSAVHERECVRGRAQLSRLAQICSQGIGDSEFNCLELRQHGFSRTCVVPILVNFEKYKKTEPSQSVLSRYADGLTNILFVGRFVPNKRHDEVLRVFTLYQRFLNPSSRLFLVGKYDEWKGYYDRLQALVQILGCREVVFPGHTSFEDLMAYYRLADLFLCRSEHEGFSVPLLESMFFRVPIVAFSAGAVTDTLGNGGVVINDPDPLILAETIHYTLSHTEVKEEVVRRQDARLQSFSRERIEVLLKKALSEGLSPVRKDQPLSMVIEGTFEDSYSLSVVNRNLGLALDRQGVQVGFHATSGPGDYVPDFSNMTNPRVKQLWERKIPHPDISIRNIYPLRIHDMKGWLCFWFFFWEETKIPEAWVELFNQLDGILVPSKFVKEILESCGVQVPIRVVPLGLDQELLHARPNKLPIQTLKRFVFLNVGSAFPRKGLDVLLSAYTREFADQDDVCLVLKSFSNTHNRVKEMLAALPKDRSPEVIYLEQSDMPAGALASLYARANCFVSPTRGEGFGLPIAEAMHFKVPVIITAFGGHLDFCDEQSAFLIPYQLVPSRSHLGVAGSQWAEPSEEALRKAMRRVFEGGRSPAIQELVDRAYERVSTYCSWDLAAKESLSFIEEVRKCSIHLGWVSTWNQRCGIAEYSRYFLQALPPNIKPIVLGSRSQEVFDGKEDRFMVNRCWEANNKKQNLDELVEVASRMDLDVVHFQFNFGFFHLPSLISAIHRLQQKGQKVAITFHAVRSLPALNEQFKLIASKLNDVDLLIVHTEGDRGYLSKLGLTRHVRHLPHGQIRFEPHDKGSLRPVLGLTGSPILATFGFFLPHKGILELVQAVAQVRRSYPDLLLLVVSSLYQSLESERYFQICQEEVKRLGLARQVIFFTDFLPFDEIAPLLQSADLIVMPYNASRESSSAAVRFALASERPVLVTSLPIFSEFDSEVLRVPTADVRDLEAGILKALSNPDGAEKTVQRARDYLKDRSWDRIASQYVSFLSEMGGWSFRDYKQRGSR